MQARSQEMKNDGERARECKHVLKKWKISLPDRGMKLRYAGPKVSETTHPLERLLLNNLVFNKIN